MKVEGRLQERLENGAVRCLTCARECIIQPGKRGFCGTRVNEDGTCHSLIYGELTAESIDPVEKKPLFHFYPGHDIYSISSAGCSFACLNCQNYHLSQVDGRGPGGGTIVMDGGTPASFRFKSPADLVRSITASGCELLAFTYNEPLIWLEYILDVAALARDAGIKIALVTNGYATPAALDLLVPVVDAANVDIKAMDDAFYKHVCKAQGVGPVLHCVKRFHDAGKAIEVTNLIIPGHNDTPAAIERLCKWCMDELDAGVPVHFSAYRPMYQMKAPATPVATLVAARDIARSTGLKHVYIGNAFVEGGEDTTCPECGAIVVARRGYSITRVALDDQNRCKQCGARLRIEGRPRKHVPRFP